MKLIISQLNSVDSSARFDLLQRAEGEAGKEYIYLTGVGSTVVGSWVTYDELGITALITTASIGPVAVAMAITDASTEFGWYQIYGSAQAKMAANCGDNAIIGREGANGVAGDDEVSGDQIFNAISREETSDAAVATVQLKYPYVTDNSN